VPSSTLAVLVCVSAEVTQHHVFSLSAVAEYLCLFVDRLVYGRLHLLRYRHVAFRRHPDPHAAVPLGRTRTVLLRSAMDLTGLQQVCDPRQVEGAFVVAVL